MGERINSLELKPTAENSPSEKLDEENFSFLCRTIDGLSKIEPEEVLADFALERTNIEDVLYTFKFISDPKVFEKLSSSTFTALDENEALEAIKFAQLFQKVLSSPPVIYEISKIEIDSNGIFIAYINVEQEKIHITWKDIDNESHLYHCLLKNAREVCVHKEVKEKDFPDKLRSYGGIRVSLIDDEIVVRFFGDSARKGYNEMNGYLPGFLKNFEANIKGVFQEQFPDKEVNIVF